MKKCLIVLVFTLAFAGFARADLWDDNYAKALAEAKQSGKYILLDFTGSDWCGWCKRLDAEVFSKKAFKDYAKESLVCVTVDFPANKPQSKKLKQQNEELSRQFNVGGYPTIILLDADGNYAAQTGYQTGGAQSYVEHLKGLVDQNRAKKGPAN